MKKHSAQRSQRSNSSYLCVLCVLCVLCGKCLFAATLPSQGELEGVTKQFGGKVAFAVLDLTTGEKVGLNSSTPVATASVIKLPIMVAVFDAVNQGRLKFESTLILRHEDKVDGSGILQDLSDDLHITLADAVMLMIVESDNTATNLVLDQLGIAPVNDEMQKLGLANTRLYKKVFLPAPQPVSEEAKQFGLGKTTADDMLRLLKLINDKQVVNAASCDRMIEILKKQRDIDAFPRYLDQFSSPEHPVTVAHKTGALDQIRNDVGIVYTPAGPVAMAGFAYDSPDTRWIADNAATLVLGRLAEAVVRAKIKK